MIGGLIVFLILSPKFLTDKPLKDNNSTKENNQYATKIQLNCEDEIILPIGTSVELLNGFVSVEPKSKMSEITYKITNNQGPTNGIVFSNNIITAAEVGKYKLRFSVFKSKTTEIYDTLSITVVLPEDDDKVKLLNNNFTANQTLTLNEIVNINAEFNSCSILSNDYITYANNEVNFKETGKTDLKLHINTAYLSYKYSFEVSIKPQINTGIVVIGEDNGVVEVVTDADGYFEILYYFKNAAGENVPQDAVVIVENNPYVGIEEVAAPFINGKCDLKLDTKIIITPTDVLIPPKEIIIIFK